MRTIMKRLGIAVLAAGLVIGLASPASAQLRSFKRPLPYQPYRQPHNYRGFGPQVSYPINPNPYIAPGLTLQQYSYNTLSLARVYRRIPPYLLGYSPYPGGGYGPAYTPMYYPQPYTYTPPTYSGGGYYPGNYSYYPSYSPYGLSYITPGIDPLTGLSASSGYGAGWTNPYYWSTNR
jgi:hypothetical protein